MTLRSTIPIRSRRQLRDRMVRRRVDLGAVIGDAAHQLVDQLAVDAAWPRRRAARRPRPARSPTPGARSSGRSSGPVPGGDLPPRRSGEGSAARPRAIGDGDQSFRSSLLGLHLGEARDVGRRGRAARPPRGARRDRPSRPRPSRRRSRGCLSCRRPSARAPAPSCRRRARRTRRGAAPRPPARRWRAPLRPATRSKCGVPPRITAPRQTMPSKRPPSATRRASPASSMAPGQRNSSTSPSAAPASRSAWRAPSSSRPTIVSLNRAATSANRRPFAWSAPS